MLSSKLIHSAFLIDRRLGRTGITDSGTAKPQFANEDRLHLARMSRSGLRATVRAYRYLHKPFEPENCCSCSSFYVEGRTL
jgi:hypothetical protein